MVRSMMNLTTLPKSFWGYALESAARILNMVPTKKVDRTPYEIWHGKAPKLSYLRVWGCEALVKRDTSDKLDSRSIKLLISDQYAVSNERDTAYQRQVFTRKRVFTIPNTAYPPSAIRRIHEDNFARTPRDTPQYAVLA
ncbi:retrotransposon protein, putative, ty1-copia subclass [Tanacetum coccineum]|uniref:Retrotransposon protein, putative, ty1-copia subclass n=1 Tax=Tanacetum coccineum TaxID=301880 RepID=A0ABQ4WRC0_9ASTR